MLLTQHEGDAEARKDGDLFAPRAGIHIPAERRRARRVRLLRVLIPLVAVMLAGVLVAWPQILPLLETLGSFSTSFDDEAPEAALTSEVAARSEQEVAAPRFMGVGSDNQPFSVTAARATQGDGRGNTTILLDHPQAEMTLSDGHWVSLEAEQGQFDREGQSLVLNGSVRLFHDGGYQLNTGRININLAAQYAESTTLTEGHGPTLELRAQGFVMDAKAGRLILVGPSTLIVRGTPP